MDKYYAGKKRTICPYYLFENTTSITCEGFQEKTKQTTKFANANKKAQFQKANCFCYECKCLVRQMNDALYEGGKNGKK